MEDKTVISNGSQSFPLFGGHQNWQQRNNSFKLKASMKHNFTIRKDRDGGLWMGAWHFVLLRYLPYDELRRNGKIPKILIHRLVPQAQYSIWIDAKMTSIVDPLLILERFLW